MLLKPLNDRILIRLDKDDQEEKVGSIILPDSAKDRRVKTGQVVAVGHGILKANGVREMPRYSAGAKVYFDAYTGNRIKVNGEELHLVPQTDVIALVVDDKSVEEVI